MTISEFNLIKKYFHREATHTQVVLGNGDDCALLQPSSQHYLAVSSDMLVEGRHFFPDADPYFLGHKCLAVNLSDLAAMGAKPLAFTLSLALPEANEVWLNAFSKGLFSIADRFHCDLIGGDTTKGPLTISITIFGEIPYHQALTRHQAKAGDDIWVSGSLGDARLALAGLLKEVTLPSDKLEIAALRLHQPEPRLTLGQALRSLAHAAIDISDGLIGDLGHILELSQMGATINVDQLPAGEMLQLQNRDLQRQFCLAGGDDYELCFTAPQKNRDAILLAAEQTQTPVTRIGYIEQQQGLRLEDDNHQIIHLPIHSFDHFSNT